MKDFEILKSDEKRLVFGWASISLTVDGVQLEDLQKDTIDPADLEEAAYEYVLNFRDTGEEHIPTMRKRGKLVESCVFTEEKQKAMGIPEGILPVGWWIGFKIEDDSAWEKVKDGTYRMFSIEGRATREEIVEKSVEDVEEHPPPPHVENYVEDGEAVAKTFGEVLKFNPYHDSRGRFATANGYASFTYAPGKSRAHDLAIAREKQRQAQQATPTPQTPAKPQKTYDRLGFADYDDADYHQLHSGAKYYKQQQLTPQQRQAVTSYLEATPEQGSLYSHSQNMNRNMVLGKQLTGKHKQTHDGLMSAMHNIGYNVQLTRYDHPEMINNLLKATGAGADYERLPISKIKAALVGQTLGENKFLSCSYNNFANAPASSKSVFTTRAVRINYKVKADVQAVMPGNGPGGSLGEMILAPTNGTANRAGKIVDVRFNGVVGRKQGTQSFTQPQIEIDIEI